MAEKLDLLETYQFRGTGECKVGNNVNYHEVARQGDGLSCIKACRRVGYFMTIWHASEPRNQGMCLCYKNYTSPPPRIPAECAEQSYGGLTREMWVALK
jgi:hypothetical protein